jgi:hypothetical protein
MQIPWYIGWTLVAAIGFGILSLAGGAPFYPLKYPSGFWGLQSELKAEDVFLRTRRTNICRIAVTARGKSSYRENRWARLLRWIWLPERIVPV